MCLLLFQYNILSTLFLKDRPRSGIRLEFEFHKCNWRKPDTKCRVPKKAGTRLRQYLWLPLAPFIPSLNCSNPDASLPYSQLSFPNKPDILAMGLHGLQLLSWSLHSSLPHPSSHDGGGCFSLDPLATISLLFTRKPFSSTIPSNGHVLIFIHQMQRAFNSLRS